MIYFFGTSSKQTNKQKQQTPKINYWFCFSFFSLNYLAIPHIKIKCIYFSWFLYALSENKQTKSIPGTAKPRKWAFQDMRIFEWISSCLLTNECWLFLLHKNVNRVCLHHSAVNFCAICRNVIISKTSAPLPNATRIDQWFKSKLCDRHRQGTWLQKSNFLRKTNYQLNLI